MWPFDELGAKLGGPLKDMIITGFEAAMLGLWQASLLVLHAAFSLADRFSVFTVSTRTGPISVLWPMMLWISGLLALGLFFWQLTTTALRGGRGFLRLIGGPVQYGVALAVTVGITAAFLAAVDGLTEGILAYGLKADTFADALSATGWLDAAGDGVKPVVLGIAAMVGVLPASLGYMLEMIFREAGIYVLVATIPVSAAGLLSGVTASWFWRCARWLLVCIVMKPALALALVLGIAISGGAEGLSGLLAGIGVLIISIFCPFVLFRLFAFIDPNSDAGAAFRDTLSSAGMDSYGRNNPAMLAGSALDAAGGSRGGGGGQGGNADGDESNAGEDATTGRFDEAEAEYSDKKMDESGAGRSSGTGASGGSAGSDSDPDAVPEGGSSAGADPSADHGSAAGGDRPYANSGSVVSSGPDTGPSGDYGGDDDHGGSHGPGSTPPPDGGGGGGGGGGADPKDGGPKSSGGGGGAAAGAEEAAVVV
ncbi:hypothetical protein AB0A63_13990 [Lentzea sp. NPDC042327]|uniref:hypothetical protein n=1 Tax=Lentzea sp. NPDC042327 TaxID=3154801 RepID=UPI0033F8A49F